MLKGNLYDIESIRTESALTVAEVRLHGECGIFKGHFPGMPITPGVCLVQIAKEIAGQLEGRNLHLSEAKDIKFIFLVTPDRTPVIRYEIVKGEKNAGSCRWQAGVFSGETLCCKMSLILCD